MKQLQKPTFSFLQTNFSLLRVLGIILIVLTGITGFSQDSSPQNIPTKFLADCEGSKSLSIVKNATFSQKETIKDSLKSNCFFWGKFNFTNISEEKIWVLKFPDNISQVFVFHKENQYQSGFHMPIKERSYSPVADQNLVKLSFSKNETQEIFFKAISYSYSEPCLKVEAIPFETFNERSLTERRNSGIFIGFILLILIYASVLFFFEKDKAYLFYSVYLVALIVYELFILGDIIGYLSPIFFPDFPPAAYFFKYVTYFGLFGYLEFLQCFFNLKNQNRFWFKILRGTILIGVIFLPIDIYFLVIDSFDSIKRADIFAISYVLIFAVVTNAFMVSLIRNYNQKHLYIIIGISFLNLGFIATAFVLGTTGKVVLTYFTIGTALEVLFFSFGLAYRRKLILKAEAEANAKFEFQKTEYQKLQKESEMTLLPIDRISKYDAFLKRLRQKIEARLDDPNLSVESLAKEMALSRSQLFRKTKNATQQSVAGYIRLVRLNKGKQLLHTTDLTVSEAAYQAGFNDPGYFSKCFFEAFGYLPSERRE